MIAMQYSFTLPADYDMGIIERRIRDKGPMLDGFPHLGFKAYLSARKGAGAVPSAENLYAPFYLWDEPDGLSNFLTSPGFAGLTRDFGWPVVRTWVVWQAEIGGDLAQARFAVRSIEAIPPHSDLVVLKAAATTAAREAVSAGALACVTGFDPTGWTYLRVALWAGAPADIAPGGQIYSVGHVSRGAHALE